jgi:hypothetical protein
MDDNYPELGRDPTEISCFVPSKAEWCKNERVDTWFLGHYRSESAGAWKRGRMAFNEKAFHDR